MIFLEEYARLLLVLHTLMGLAAVGASTHLVVWMWDFRRGNYARLHGAKRFAKLSAVIFLVTFAVGNLLYPSYKTSVRSEYLDSGSAVTRDREARAAQRRGLLHSRGALVANSDTSEVDTVTPARATIVARWFDVKEHWVALGAVLALAALAMLHAFAKTRVPALAVTALVFAVGAAGTTWLAAIIGIWVSSYRAVGAL